MLGGKKTGGMNVYVRDFARELGCYGIQVDVFTRAQGACQPLVEHELGPGGRVVHITAGPEAPIPVAEVGDYLDEFTDGVLAFAAAEGITYDLILSHYWLSGLVGIALRPLWGGLPLVHMYHTLGKMKNQIAQHPSEFASYERIDGETYVAHVADHLIAATPAEEAQLIELYGADSRKITVIPPGVDLARFHPIGRDAARATVGIGAHCRVILFVGRIEPLKG
ncbi:MAG: glycosyltransferase, partial [Anaerolineales bacterium]|nr:glycosyltransferase [Anaerolineales bacterium]